MNRFAKAVDQLLVWFILIQMIALTAVVIFAVLARITGNSVSWYDEIAAIQLAWLTYYGGAYAALHRRHIGFDTVLLSIPMPIRAWAVIFAEAVVVGFFVLLAYTGYEVLVVLEGEYLVSLTWVPIQFTQSVIPIGAALFIICELLSFPNYYGKTCAGISLEHAEIEEEVETELAKAGAKS
ncbi:MAG: TRAP transporter small permease subunit [Litoricola sp.]|nr:TRAP transporter small permease subunit [Litorivicinus sp.]MBL6825311.1 TRAP transporter small permease subunit [Litorivicinus sp.]